MEPRQLFNIHKLCIIKHASKVSYMQPNQIQTTFTQQQRPLIPTSPYTNTNTNTNTYIRPYN